jgi:hypothetical protein
MQEARGRQPASSRETFQLAQLILAELEEVYKLSCAKRVAGCLATPSSRPRLSTFSIIERPAAREQVHPSVPPTVMGGKTRPGAQRAAFLSLQLAFSRCKSFKRCKARLHRVGRSQAGEEEIAQPVLLGGVRGAGLCSPQRLEARQQRRVHRGPVGQQRLPIRLARGRSDVVAEKGEELIGQRHLGLAVAPLGWRIADGRRRWAIARYHAGWRGGC